MTKITVYVDLLRRYKWKKAVTIVEFFQLNMSAMVAPNLQMYFSYLSSRSVLPYTQIRARERIPVWSVPIYVGSTP
jgi:hypothetical protein